MTTIFTASRNELLALPSVNWRDPTTASSLLIVNDKKLHDSGWRQMLLIAVEGQGFSAVPKHIIGYPDDIRIDNRTGRPYGLQIDMTPKNFVHLWSRYGKFFIPASGCSTVEIIILPAEA